MQPGDKLPTERILAVRLKVSRNTMREAITRRERVALSKPARQRHVPEGYGFHAYIAHAADARRWQ